jgi:D-cysteine desulfhydrase
MQEVIVSASAPALSYPPRLDLARIPTPLERLARLSDKLGVEVLFKRDDMTGVGLTGNKVRKLEFLLAEALEQKARVVLTCGGAQSNHARATALACAKLGLESRLILRVPNPDSPPPTEGNLLLDKLVGAEIVWITPEEYADRANLMAAMAARLTKLGRSAYVIPEGGSNHLGAWGYIKAVEELAADLGPQESGRASCRERVS